MSTLHVNGHSRRVINGNLARYHTGLSRLPLRMRVINERQNMTGSVVAKGLKLITLLAWLSTAALAASLGVVPVGVLKFYNSRPSRSGIRGKTCIKRRRNSIHGPLVLTRRMTEFATSRDAPMRGWLKLPAFLVFLLEEHGRAIAVPLS